MALSSSFASATASDSGPRPLWPCGQIACLLGCSLRIVALSVERIAPQRAYFDCAHEGQDFFPRDRILLPKRMSLVASGLSVRPKPWALLLLRRRRPRSSEVGAGDDCGSRSGLRREPEATAESTWPPRSARRWPVWRRGQSRPCSAHLTRRAPNRTCRCLTQTLWYQSQFVQRLVVGSS